MSCPPIVNISLSVNKKLQRNLLFYSLFLCVNQFDAPKHAQLKGVNRVASTLLKSDWPPQMPPQNFCHIIGFHLTVGQVTLRGKLFCRW